MARNVGFVVEYMCDVVARTVQKATSYSPALGSGMCSSSVGGERVGLGKCNVSPRRDCFLARQVFPAKLNTVRLPQGGPA